MKCITVLYPLKGNESFDFDFYRRRHVPLIQDILGSSLHRIEVRRGTAGHDGAAPQFTCVVSILISDWAAYEKAMATRTQELLDEVPLFSKVMPVIQVDEVLYSSVDGKV